jgi:hypothetical protein
MKFLKQYRFVLIIILVMGVLVVFRSFSRTSFRYDAARWAETSVQGSNLLTVDQLSTLTGEIMLLNLGSEADLSGSLQDEAVTVKPESITDKANLKLIRNHKGPVLLFSDDLSVSARVWMVLSEMGMKNIYILRVPGSETE